MLYLTIILTLPLKWSMGKKFHAEELAAALESVRREALREEIGGHVGGLHVDGGNNPKGGALANVCHGSGELNAPLVRFGVDAQVDSCGVVVVDWGGPGLQRAKFLELIAHALHMLYSSHDCLRLSITCRGGDAVLLA